MRAIGVGRARAWARKKGIGWVRSGHGCCLGTLKALMFVFSLRKKVRPDRPVDRYMTALNDTTGPNYCVVQMVAGRFGSALEKLFFLSFLRGPHLLLIFSSEDPSTSCSCRPGIRPTSHDRYLLERAPSGESGHRLSVRTYPATLCGACCPR